MEKSKWSKICAVLAILLFSVLSGTKATAEVSAPVIPEESLMQQRYRDVEPIRKNPVLKWKAKAVNGVAKEEWTNCIAYKGVLYGTANSVLHAIDIETGKILWTVKGPGGHPAISNDTLYAAGTKNFYAVDLSTGKIKWEIECGPMLCSWRQSYGFMKPAVVISGDTAFFGNKSIDSLDCPYYAVDLKTKKIIWKKKPKNEAWTARLSVGKGRLYGSGHDDPKNGDPGAWGRPRQGKLLLAMDCKTGETIWSVDGMSSNANPVYYNETVLFGSGEGDKSKIYAFDAKTGKPLWDIPCAPGGKDKSIFGLAVHKNYVVAGGSGRNLRCFDIKEKKELWNFKPEGVTELLNPVIHRDVVYVSSCAKIGGEDFSTGRNSPIYGLDLKTGDKLWECNIPGTDCLENGEKRSWNSYSPAWVYQEGKKIFVLAFTGYFYCFEEPGEKK
jgi:outer membrane protein assembly factor BamB